MPDALPLARNPFRTLSSSRPFEDPRCSVRRDEFELDDGHRGVHLVVEIPAAVAVVPVLEDGRFLLLRQWRYALGAPMWEVPAGRVHDGESIDDAAARELREETGYAAGALRSLGRFFPIAGISDHCGHLVAAERCRVAGPRDLEPTERIEVVPVAPDQLRAMLARAEIEDGFALAALGRYLFEQR